MKFVRGRRFWLIGGIFGYMLAALAFSAVSSALATQRTTPAPQSSITAFDGPTHSSPIALNADKTHIWVVNPNDDSVSVLGDLDGTPKVIKKIFVGANPQGVALGAGTGSSYYAYVVNAAGNSVSIIRVTNSTPTSLDATVEKELTTGAEPWNVVTSPDGKRVFVANSVQDTITVIDTANNTILGNVDLRNSVCNDPDRARHFQPRGLAVTQNNDRLFVTRFLSFTGGPNPKQVTDDGKVGLVCQLNINTSATNINGYAVAGAITLAPEITGFQIDSNGDKVPDDTLAFPNQLQSVVIRGSKAYLPNIAASTAGPFKFNVDTQAFVNILDIPASGLATENSAQKFINLHLGARNPEPGKTKLFFSNPWAIDFRDQPSGPDNAYVVSAGSDLLVKLNVDDTGTLTFTVDADTTRYIDLNGEEANNSGENAGKNPLGIVIRGNRAYTMNRVSRNLSVVDLDADKVTQVIRLIDLPKPGSKEEELLVGAEVFFSSRGVFDRPPGTTVSTRDRLSSEGWQNCASCHFEGWTDGNVWSFDTGPRKSIPLNGTFSPHNPDDQRLLNWSAVREETPDFELNIRNVSGPGNLAQPLNGSVFDPNHGLLISDTGDINFAPSVINNFNLPNTGRKQVTVTLPGSNTAWPALDAMNEWIRFAVRTPNGALTSEELVGGLNANDVRQGRNLFFKAGCQTCHAGTKWTISTVDFTPPPALAEVPTELNPPPPAGVNPVGAQFFNRILRDIKSFNLGIAGVNPIGNNIGGVEKAQDGKDALGTDHNKDGKGEGFNVPSLLGIFHLPPYYHNGACETLECVLSNVNHRRSGLKPGKADPLDSAENRRKLQLWLETLDSETAFPTNLRVRKHNIFLDPPRPFAGTQVIVGANIELFGTRADLIDLAEGNAIKVKFTGPGLNSVVDLPVAAFEQDFGTAAVTTTWDVPNTVGQATITVEVDSDKLIDDEDADDVAKRDVRVSAQPADRTVPTVSDVRISDDNPFNDNDPFATTQQVKIRFKASDPTSSGGQQTSGLDAYCVVSYYYSVPQRRWVEKECEFASLPAPDSGTNDTFTVDAELSAKKGVSYAFVWVRDKAGNISKKPGFDFISIVPGPNVDIELDRNDVYLIRLTLNAGQSFTFDFKPSSGDIDVQVFDRDGNRLAVSANNGPQPEQVKVSATADNTFIQIEVKAIVNSTFRIETSQAALANAQGIARNGIIASPGAGPAQAGGNPTPIVAGPPALQTAIGDVAPTARFLPISVK